MPIEAPEPKKCVSPSEERLQKLLFGSNSSDRAHHNQPDGDPRLCEGRPRVGRACSCLGNLFLGPSDFRACHIEAPGQASWDEGRLEPNATFYMKTQRRFSDV